jgi:predicted RNA-binding protein with TRAM domain
MDAILRIGDLIRMVIGDVAFGGDGVARVSGLVIFVPFTIDGDEVEVEITEIRKRYARGEACPDRNPVRPPCPAGLPLLHPLRWLPDAAHRLRPSIGAETKAG